MTKQEEIEAKRGLIRETIKSALLSLALDIDDEFYGDLWKRVDKLEEELSTLGVVIRVDKKINGNLVNELYDAMLVIEEADCKLLVKQALDKAGYTAVEPLEIIGGVYPQELYQKLTNCLNRVKLGVASRLIYFDPELKLFILAVHTTSPEDTEEVGNIALDAIRENVLPELEEAGFGFTCKQI